MGILRKLLYRLKWRARRGDYDALADALDDCRCRGHREYMRHLVLRYGMSPFDAALEMVSNIGSYVQANNIGVAGARQPATDSPPPVPEAVAPIDLANMTTEDEERVFYALLANRYDRRLELLADRLHKVGVGDRDKCVRIADNAIERWCQPIEDDLSGEDLFDMLMQIQPWKRA